ncbi:hypothetical protein PINS_up010288 [Pythium insidiosum]|nr:hypothetical protein PINS_up010288 [Pythium insidiosum]
MKTSYSTLLLIVAALAAASEHAAAVAAADDASRGSGDSAAMLGVPQHEERAAGETLLTASDSNHTKTASDSAFSKEEQALWIDRHNYFRMTALPFAAANMLRMRWSAELATQAAAETAAACAAPTSSAAGKNVAVVAPQDKQSVVDAAFQQWAVDPALKAFATLKAPKPGDAVGAGVYNTYSQVVWSSTSQVGCARAPCDGSKVAVVCKYAAPGNDGKSPWYVHGPTGSACPDGTVSKVGLCGPADDAATKELAPIPVGANAYDVFKDFIPKMQAILQGAQASPSPDSDKNSGGGGGAVPTATPTPSSSRSKAPEGTTKPAANTGSGAGGGSTTNQPSKSDDAGVVVPSSTPSPSMAPSSPSDPPASPAPGMTYIRVKRSKSPSTEAPSSDFDPGKVRPGSATGDFINTPKTSAPTTLSAKPTDPPASGAGKETTKPTAAQGRGRAAVQVRDRGRQHQGRAELDGVHGFLGGGHRGHDRRGLRAHRGRRRVRELPQEPAAAARHPAERRHPRAVSAAEDLMATTRRRFYFV